MALYHPSRVPHHLRWWAVRESDETERLLRAIVLLIAKEVARSDSFLARRLAMLRGHR